MKHCFKNMYLIIVAIILCLCFVACNNKVSEIDVWENAIYKSDTELGTGAKTITVTVDADSKIVKLTINTDKEKLGDALAELEIIKGEKGAYGLYVKEVNGIVADYDIDQSYWSLCKNGEPLQTGVDGVNIVDDDKFELIRIK